MRFTLAILLLLTSLRLAASGAGLALNPADVAGQKAHLATRHDVPQLPWLLAESNFAAESGEDAPEGVHPTDLPVLVASVFAPALAASLRFSLLSSPVVASSRPLFLLFENFRI